MSSSQPRDVVVGPQGQITPPKSSIAFLLDGQSGSGKATLVDQIESAQMPMSNPATGANAGHPPVSPTPSTYAPPQSMMAPSIPSNETYQQAPFSLSTSQYSYPRPSLAAPYRYPPSAPEMVPANSSRALPPITALLTLGARSAPVWYASGPPAAPENIVYDYSNLYISDDELQVDNPFRPRPPIRPTSKSQEQPLGSGGVAQTGAGYMPPGVPLAAQDADTAAYLAGKLDSDAKRVGYVYPPYYAPAMSPIHSIYGPPPPISQTQALQRYDVVPRPEPPHIRFQTPPQSQAAYPGQITLLRDRSKELVSTPASASLHQQLRYAVDYRNKREAPARDGRQLALPAEERVRKRSSVQTSSSRYSRGSHGSSGTTQSSVFSREIKDDSSASSVSSYSSDRECRVQGDNRRQGKNDKLEFKVSTVHGGQARIIVGGMQVDCTPGAELQVEKFNGVVKTRGGTNPIPVTAEFSELRQESESAKDESERSDIFTDDSLDSDFGSELEVKVNKSRVKVLERAKPKVSSWGSQEAKKDDKSTVEVDVPKQACLMKKDDSGFGWGNKKRDKRKSTKPDHEKPEDDWMDWGQKENTTEKPTSDITKLVPIEEEVLAVDYGFGFGFGRTKKSEKKAKNDTKETEAANATGGEKINTFEAITLDEPAPLLDLSFEDTPQNDHNFGVWGSSWAADTTSATNTWDFSAARTATESKKDPEIDKNSWSLNRREPKRKKDGIVSFFDDEEELGIATGFGLSREKAKDLNGSSLGLEKADGVKEEEKKHDSSVAQAFSCLTPCKTLGELKSGFVDVEDADATSADESGGKSAARESLSKDTTQSVSILTEIEIEESKQEAVHVFDFLTTTQEFERNDALLAATPATQHDASNCILQINNGQKTELTQEALQEMELDTREVPGVNLRPPKTVLFDETLSPNPDIEDYMSKLRFRRSKGSRRAGGSEVSTAVPGTSYDVGSTYTCDKCRVSEAYPSFEILREHQLFHQEPVCSVTGHDCLESFNKSDPCVHLLRTHGISQNLSPSVYEDIAPKSEEEELGVRAVSFQLNEAVLDIPPLRGHQDPFSAVPPWNDKGSLRSPQQEGSDLDDTSEKSYFPQDFTSPQEWTLNPRTASTTEDFHGPPSGVKRGKPKQSILNAIKKLFRPEPRIGYQRVEWTCGCGEELYADFWDHSKEQLEAISNLIQAAGSESQGSLGPSRLPLATRYLGSSRLRSGSSSTNTDSTIRSQSFSSQGSPATTVPSSFSSKSEIQTTATFLELCVNTGEHLKELAEIDLTEIRCDSDFFGTIYSRYLQIRGYRARFWLLKPKTISYVRFSVEERRRVGILQKPLAVPPRKEVDSKRWIYEPCPLEGGPPIAEDLFLHYLTCRGASKRPFWMLRLPRKLKTSILGSGAGPAAFGWGVHIDEGINYKVFFWANFVALMVGGVFATLWTVFMHDFQGGFGFACWLAAVLNTLTFAFVYRWRQE